MGLDVPVPVPDEFMTLLFMFMEGLTRPGSFIVASPMLLLCGLALEGRRPVAARRRCSCWRRLISSCMRIMLEAGFCDDDMVW